MPTDERVVRVLITRPAHQQDVLTRLCSEHGFEPVSLPCLDILPVPVTLGMPQLADIDLVVFTSRNAVDFAHTLLPFPWQNTAALAIGNATARGLEVHGQSLLDSPPSPFNSEALVAQIRSLAARQPIRRVLVVKGVGGRDHLHTALSGDGIVVESIDVYKRVLPAVSDAMKQRVFVDEPVDIVCVSSDEVLRNLVHIAERHHDTLAAWPIIVNSDRAAALAGRLGFDDSIIVANPPGDQGQIAALLNWRASRQRGA